MVTYQQVVGAVAILAGILICIFNNYFQNIIWVGKAPFGKPVSKSQTFNFPASKKIVIYIVGIIAIIFGLIALFS